MANEEHLAILRQGVEVWNRWRDANPDGIPDLSEVDLHEVDLYRVDFQRANLQRANLQQAKLQWAKLLGADLLGADLQRARLERVEFEGAFLQVANLLGAFLHGTNLYGADLNGANLRAANLQFVHLVGASLEGADLTDAIVGSTTFGAHDLRGIRGLDTIRHSRPSTIGIDTLYASGGDIPEVFLRGCGVPDSMIDYARSLVTAERPIDYYSCFISYSSHDEALAERLYADLQARGVRCWYAPHDLEIGEPILSGIDRGIRLHDKLLLILSAAAVESVWIEQEVEMALARERTERRRVLFPIRIDDAVSAQTASWPALVWTQRHVGDFRQWKAHDSYQQAFQRLLRDLKTEPR